MFDTTHNTEEQKLMADAVAQMAKYYPHAYFMTQMKAGMFPDQFWRSLAQGGYLGAPTSEEFGGAGFSTGDLVAFMLAMAQGGLGSYFLMHHLTCVHAVTRLGSQAQKRAYLPAMVAGDRWVLATLERTDGRTLTHVEARAERTKGGYRLHGTKRYVAGAEGATHMLVVARSPDSAVDSEDGLSLFVVPTDAPGVKLDSREINVRVSLDREPIAATGDAFFDVILTDALVGEDARIGAEGAGAAALREISAMQMLLMAANAVGWGDRIIDKAVAYANSRIIYDEPIASYQAIQHPMVLARTEVEMAKLLLERAAEFFETSTDADARLQYAALAKYQATEASFAACDIGIQAHGGSGFDRENGLITLWPLILMSRLVPLCSARILERFAQTEFGLPSA